MSIEIKEKSASTIELTNPVAGIQPADVGVLGGVKFQQYSDNSKIHAPCVLDKNGNICVPLASKYNRTENGDITDIIRPGVLSPSALQFEVDDLGRMDLKPATTSTLGGVKVDGTTITVDSNGKISAVQLEYPTKTSDLVNDSGFITSEYHDSTKQNLLTAGNNITIDADGTISAIQPNEYIRNADVSGNTLKLFTNSDRTISFTPTGGSGGGSDGVSGYYFSSSQSFTDVDKTHLKEIYNNKNIHMSINGLTVIRIMGLGAKWGFVVINTNGATSNQVLVYSVNVDSAGNITSDTFSLFMSYYLVGNSSELSGDIITSENWSQYIPVSGGGDWQYTSSSAESNLYNAKEMIVYWTDNYNYKRQSYLNFTANFNFEVGQTLGTGWTNQEIYLDMYDSSNGSSITYSGSSFSTSNCLIYFILYKT